MQKVVMEERAYDALRAYLERAEAQLATNPDKAEIISDLEQAIADKCDRVLGPTKNVVTAPEIAQVLLEMGPVHDASSGENAGPREENSSTKDAPRPDPNAPRRLYRIREGALLAGVCNGLAAYFSLDVTVMRVICVVLAVLTSGGLIFAYLVLMFVLPPVSTSEEHAAAHGWPFNAQEVIDRVKQSARTGGKSFLDGCGEAAQRRQARQARRAHRQQLRAQRRAFAHGAVPMDYASQVLAGVFIPIASVISAALFVGLALAIISIITSGTVFGWVFPGQPPFWVQIVVLVVFYHLIAWPLHAVSHGPFHEGRGWISMWGGLLWIGFTALFMWLAYQHLPGVREFIDQLPDSLRNRSAADSFSVLLRWVQ